MKEHDQMCPRWNALNEAPWDCYCDLIAAVSLREKHSLVEPLKYYFMLREITTTALNEILGPELGALITSIPQDMLEFQFHWDHKGAGNPKRHDCPMCIRESVAK